MPASWKSQGNRYELSHDSTWRRSSLVGPSSTDRSSGLVAAPPPTPVALLLDVAFASVYDSPVRSFVPRYSVRVCSALYRMYPRFSTTLIPVNRASLFTHAPFT